MKLIGSRIVPVPTQTAKHRVTAQISTWQSRYVLGAYLQRTRCTTSRIDAVYVAEVSITWEQLGRKLCPPNYLFSQMENPVWLTSGLRIYLCRVLFPRHRNPDRTFHWNVLWLFVQHNIDSCLKKEEEEEKKQLYSGRYYEVFFFTYIWSEGVKRPIHRGVSESVMSLDRFRVLTTAIAHSHSLESLSLPTLLMREHWI